MFLLKTYRLLITLIKSVWLRRVSFHMTTEIKYSNPVPVAVALVPYQGKLVGIRRGIEPRKGQVALPGGFINSGETFNQALSRELFEETGIKIDDKKWKLFHIGDSLQSNRILIFGLATEIDNIDLGFKSSETQEVILLDDKSSLAFPLHEESVKKYFSMFVEQN